MWKTIFNEPGITIKESDTFHYTIQTKSGTIHHATGRNKFFRQLSLIRKVEMYYSAAIAGKVADILT